MIEAMVQFMLPVWVDVQKRRTLARMFPASPIALSCQRPSARLRH